jgi:rhomboid family GlyGly-CTERM serine protease
MRRAAHWGVPAALCLCSLLVESGGALARGWFRFDRAAISGGEAWRLVTGHLAHLGFGHFVLNAIALLLIWYLAGREFTVPAWLVVIASSIAGIDMGLWYLDPQLAWYVGLSGLLHGIFAAGLVARWHSARRESIVLGLLLAGKIAYEQWLGPLPGSEASAGGSVVVNAHLYGALSGAAAACLLRIGVRGRQPI